MTEPNPTLVTLADHDAGFKEIEVTLRNGTTQSLRLTAPPRRKARGLGVQVVKSSDPWPVVEACLPDGTAEIFLDRLEPVSADLVEFIALALTFGLPFQKKMEAAGLSAMTALGKPDANLHLSPPATP